MSEIGSFALAVFAGFFPALCWLWFWLREDSKHPEPRRLIALAFFAGMVTVAVVIPIEEAVEPYLSMGAALFVVWAAIEEICKYLAARVTVLWRREDDEPIDPVIYLVTTALGFSAVENVLFLLSPLSGGTLLSTIQTGDLRFVGATLVHVLSSSVVGMALAFTFYGPRWAKRLAVLLGVILAVLLHGAFNVFILNAGPDETLRVLLIVWVGVVVLLAALEWIKRLRPRFS